MISNRNLNRSLPGWGKIILLTILLAFIVGLAAAPPAQAVPNEQDAALQALMDKAEANGTVRVIVGLNVPFTPEGELAGTQAVQIQQQAIQIAQNQVWQQIAGYTSELKASYQYIPYMAVIVDEAALAKLASLPEVISIEEDQLSAPSLASSVPVIGGNNAWAAGYTGAGQTVAILDTGVDKTHPFLDGGKVVSEACFSTTGFDLTNGHYESVCPGGAPFSTATGSGIDCVAAAAGYPGAQDNCRHGTHVAGIAAGDGGGTSNIGVARDANIIAIQVFSLFTDLDGAYTYSSDQISGLERVYALRNTYNIAAVNMSLGGSRYYSACDGDSRKAIIDTLRADGIATIIATGNNGFRDSISAPGCISSAVSVGATDDFDNVASFSNIASFIDLLAPGVSITSSIPGGSTAAWNGTSMATPHVAGAWAVVKSYKPDATVDEILAVFKSTGSLVDDGRIGGFVENIPRIYVDRAINALNAPPMAASDGAPTALNTAVTINVLSNDSDLNGDLLTITYVGTPAHGTAVKVNSTSIQYTPNTGYSGADSFTYTISDGNGGSDTGTVYVIVDGESVFLPAILKN